MLDITELIVASGNQGKVTEIREILRPLNIVVRSLKDIWDPIPDIDEPGDTFEENARIKAQWVFAKTGMCSLADDSGLEVDALNGEPGVRSARYCGTHGADTENNNLLLCNLSNIPSEQRTARFRCVIVLVTPSGEYIHADGICEGMIGFTPEGTNGFGYDPLFTPLGYMATFAQLDSSIKHTLSHRGKALAELVKQLRERIT